MYRRPQAFHTNGKIHTHLLVVFQQKQVQYVLLSRLPIFSQQGIMVSWAFLWFHCIFLWKTNRAEPGYPSVTWSVCSFFPGPYPWLPMSLMDHEISLFP